MLPATLVQDKAAVLPTLRAVFTAVGCFTRGAQPPVTAAQYRVHRNTPLLQVRSVL